MNDEIIIHALINLIVIGILIYIYRTNKTFFIVSLLVLLLIVFIIPEFLIPSSLWQLILIK